MTSFRLVTIFAIFSAVLACVLLISSPAPVQGYDATITIEPAAPTEGDFVHIGITGLYNYSSGCSTTSGQYGSVYPDSASYSISGQTITIQVMWTFAVGACNADSNEGSYGFTFDIGPLAAGDYTVEAYGVEPYGDEYATVSFTVTPGNDIDGDGIVNASDNCPNWPNPAQNLPPWPVVPGDPDCDGFTTTVENSAGTAPLAYCGTDAWPADINNDGFVDIIGDIAALTAEFGKSVPPAPVRYDIAPDPPDGFIDVIGDIARLAGLFGQSCA